jgi:hypothetical protein
MMDYPVLEKPIPVRMVDFGQEIPCEGKPQMVNRILSAWLMIDLVVVQGRLRILRFREDKLRKECRGLLGMQKQLEMYSGDGTWRRPFIFCPDISLEYRWR